MNVQHAEARFTDPAGDAVGALSTNPDALSTNPDALSTNPAELSGNPTALSGNPNPLPGNRLEMTRPDVPNDPEQAYRARKGASE